MLKISLILGAIAALADVAGGLVLVRAKGVERYLRYFVALGAGFLMAVALLEMAPGELRSEPATWARYSSWPDTASFICWSTPSTAISITAKRRITTSWFRARTGMSVLAGLSVHALFDGVAIGSGFVVSNWLGWLIFLAIFLHKAPEGFTMASRDAGQRTQPHIGLLLRSGTCRGNACWACGD